MLRFTVLYSVYQCAEKRFLGARSSVSRSNCLCLCFDFCDNKVNCLIFFLLYSLANLCERQIIRNLCECWLRSIRGEFVLLLFNVSQKTTTNSQHVHVFLVWICFKIRSFHSLNEPPHIIFNCSNCPIHLISKFNRYNVQFLILPLTIHTKCIEYDKQKKIENTNQSYPTITFITQKMIRVRNIEGVLT